MIRVNITKRLLEFILPTEYPKVYRHVPKGLIEGHRVTAYSTEPIPGRTKAVAALGAWSEGVFMTEDAGLAKVLKTVIKE